MDAKNIREILNKLLDRNNLSLPYPGKPLYSYHLAKQEYQELKQLLMSNVALVKGPVYSYELCGAFTLYVAEWFRREYQSGWSWDPILKSLGIADTLPTHIRNEIVQKGLRGYWKREILQYDAYHANYLGSVFKEGGFPSSLLKEKDNKYLNVFVKIMARCNGSNLPDKSLLDALIESEIQELPQAFKQDETRLLILDIIKCILSMVNEFELSNSNDPIETLNKVSPAWRKAFPLPLDDDQAIADEFLRNLFNSSISQTLKKQVHANNLSCIHELSADSNLCTTTILLPEKIIFEIKNPCLVTSARIKLVIIEGLDIEYVCQGYISLANYLATICINKTQFNFQRRDINQVLRLGLEVNGQVISEKEIVDSSIDFRFLPVAFSLEHPRKLVGQGSFSTCLSALLLSIPEEYYFSGGISLEGMHQEKVLGNPTYKVMGKVTLLNQRNEQFVITCSNDQEVKGTVQFLNQDKSWLTIPNLLFKDIPNAVILQENKGSPEPLHPYKNGDKCLSLPEHCIFGAQIITLKDKVGKNILRKRIGLLPQDFNIKFRGITPLEAIFDIQTIQPIEIHFLDSDVTSTLISSHQGKQYLLKAKTHPPLHIKIQVKFNGNEPIEFLLPYLAVGAIAYSSDGKLLKDEITINQLIGSRLHLFSLKDISTYCIEAVLSTNNLSTKDIPFYRWKIRVAEKGSVINLYSYRPVIEGLLSLVDDLDAKVTLRIFGMGQSIELNIQHYDIQLIWINEKVGYRAKDITPVATDISIQPKLISVSDINMKAIDLIETNVCGWKYYNEPKAKLTTAPWLIIPAKGSKLFRPRLAKLPKNIHLVQDGKSLQYAAQAYNPKLNKNIFTLNLQELCSGLHHTGWKYIQVILETYSYLPLNTFLVLKHLARNPKVLACTLFMLDLSNKFDISDRHELINRFETELCIAWELIPVSAWKFAVEKTIEYWKFLLGDDGSYGKTKSLTLLKSYSHLSPLLHESFHQYYINGNLSFGGDRFDESFIQGIIFDGIPPLIEEQHTPYQRLLQDNPIDLEDDYYRWPTYLTNIRWRFFSALNHNPFRLKDIAISRQDVVYLPFCMAYYAAQEDESFFHEVMQVNTTYQHKSAHNPLVLFNIKQVMDFDRQWFDYIFPLITKYFLIKDRY